MPRRKRPKSPSSSTSSSASATSGANRSDDAIERFAAALRASEEREAAERERQRAEREHADTLDAARRDLEQAIEQVRTARRTGSGVAEADATWRAAKARVIELETGAPPDWAGAPTPEERDASGDDGDEADDHGDEADDHG